MQRKSKLIYKRKDGRWEGRYRLGTNGDGKVAYRSVYGKSFSEVKKKLADCQTASFVAEPSSRKKPFFRDAVLLWQKSNCNRYKGATEMKYDFLLERHILPELGSYRLVEINTLVLANFMNEKLKVGRIDRKGGLSSAYVRTIMLLVFEILDFAVGEDMCPQMKIKIRKPIGQKKELNILDADAHARLENQLIENPDGTNVGILLSLKTGLRISEVCALKWSDIDFKEAILYIRSTVARVKNSDNGKMSKLIIDTPKTKSSIRKIPISKSLMNSIVRLHENSKSEYVISEKAGFISPRTYEYRFHKVLNECGNATIMKRQFLVAMSVLHSKQKADLMVQLDLC